MTHRLLISLLVSGMAACTAQGTMTATTAPAPAPAPAPGPVVTAQVQPAPAPASHPAYLHALTDLRSARGYLQRPAGLAVKWDENIAIREIDAAIGEIKHAAIDDGKPIEDHPAVDVPEWGGRLQRAHELVLKAKQDISAEEDNGAVAGLRGRAEHHIDEAVRAIDAGIEESHHPVVVEQTAPPAMGEGQHPAYMHAMSDLRLARAYLAKPARPDVKWDENGAIRHINNALGEIKKAAIDDGKPMDERPPVDVALAHRDRLRKAMELLHGAAEDIEKREDDVFAKGLRHRAVEQIRAAEKDVRNAIEDRKNQ